MPRSHRSGSDQVPPPSPRQARGKDGLNVTRKKRADGSVLEYFYNRATKEFLGHDRTAAEAKLRGEEVPVEINPASIDGLIAHYKSTNKYKRLAPGTKGLYDRYLAQISTGWGKLHCKEIRSGTIEAIKDALQDEPGKCNMVLALFRILLRNAVRLEYVPSNVAAKPGRIEMDPRTTVWTCADETKFLATARLSLKLGFLLMLYTCQRVSDVLDMDDSRLSRKDDRWFIALRQRKTGTLLDVPLHKNLVPLVEQRLAQKERNSRLVGSPHELVWSRRNFSRAWDRTMKLAEMQGSGLQRRDLRRTGIVRMAEAGATTPMIAAISGHAIDYCQSIIDTYLPRRTEVAIAAIEMWERAGDQPQSNIVRLAAKTGTQRGT